MSDAQTHSNAGCHIINLPVEILDSIFEFVSQPCPGAGRAKLFPLLTVSRLFHSIAIKVIFRTVFLNLRTKREYCDRCKTPHRLTTSERIKSLFNNLRRIRNLEIDIDTKKTPMGPWKGMFSLVKRAPAIQSVTIRIGCVVGWDSSRQAPELIVYDVLRRFYLSFELLNQIKWLRSLECHISPELWFDHFTSTSRRNMSKQIPESVKELTLNTWLPCYPPELESLRLIDPTYPDDLPAFEGPFAQTWSPILSLKQLTKLELNPPPWYIRRVDHPVHLPVIDNTGLESLIINNGPGCGETTCIASLLLVASNKLSCFSWLDSPFPIQFNQMNSSNTQSIRFCLPASLVHLHVSGMSEEEENDDKVADWIPVADLLKAVEPLPALVRLEIDPQRFRLYKSPFKLACVFSRNTTICTLTIVGCTIPRNQLTDEFGQLSHAYPGRCGTCISTVISSAGIL